MPKPSVGRVVHYVSYGTPGGEYKSECRAAIITAVIDNHWVRLGVINPTGLFFHEHAQLDEGGRMVGGTWHWPERVEE